VDGEEAVIVEVGGIVKAVGFVLVFGVV